MSRCGHYQGYNDEWIRAHITEYTSWRNMFNAYYEEFHFGTYRNFRSHLYNDLGMTRKFTDEQNAWIVENYPNMTLNEIHKEFCQRFQIGRAKETIRMQANKLGVRMNHETVKRAYDFDHYNAHPIGQTVIRTNSYGNSTVWEKTAEGWKRQSHLAVGEVPAGHRVVHLDGDFRNNERDNLAVITTRVNSLMTANRFWSIDPEITKTGVLWCDLHELLEKAGAL